MANTTLDTTKLHTSEVEEFSVPRNLVNVALNDLNERC